MHFVVVGCGRVGSGLALELTRGGHSVAVIDKRPEAFALLGTDFPGQTVSGIGFDRDRLGEAGIDRADGLAAVTTGDNSNIVAARVARETFGIEHVVARIYDPRRAAIYQRLGIPTVATTAWTTERVLRRLLPREPAVEWVDGSAQVMLVERQVPATWAGHAVDELEVPERIRVAALSRLGIGRVPKPGLLLQEGDAVFLAVSGEALDDVDPLLDAGPGKGGH